MKKAWLVMALLLATPVSAQTVEQLERARSIVVEKEGADAVKNAVADDVDHINVRIDIKAPEGERPALGRRGVSTDVVISPGDPEFAAVLAAAKAAAARKATAKATELDAVGIAADPVEK